MTKSTKLRKRNARGNNNTAKKLIPDSNIKPTKTQTEKNRDYIRVFLRVCFRTITSFCAFTVNHFVATLFLIGLVLTLSLPNENPNILHFVWGILGLMLGWVINTATDGGSIFFCRRSFSGGYKELDHQLLNTRCDTSWMNLGYWKTRRGQSGGDPQTYAQACENMTMLVGEHASLSHKDKLLDVGFGRGDQLGVWRKSFSVKSIHGINLSPSEVAFARRKLPKYVPSLSSHGRGGGGATGGGRGGQGGGGENRGGGGGSSSSRKDHLKEEVCINVGSATDIPYDDHFFSKVVSVDSAYHYVKRTDFMSEACRVLRPGGTLCLADIILPQKPQTCFGRLALKLFCSLSGIPKSNLCDHETYLKQLEKRGFVNVKIVEKLDNDVFLGWSTFMRNHKHTFGPLLQPSVFSTYSAAASMFDFIGRMQLLSFVVVVATKKQVSTAPGGGATFNSMSGGQRSMASSTSGVGTTSSSPPRINRMKSSSAIHQFA